MNIQTLLQKTDTHIQGRNSRLFWQTELEGYAGEINEHTRPIVCNGWHVIKWEGKKPITLYFGDSFDIAMTTFAHYNEEIQE